MTLTKRCCDCDFYIPGEKPRNCMKHKDWNFTTGALADACYMFAEKTEKGPVQFEPIIIAKKKRGRRGKNADTK